MLTKKAKLFDSGSERLGFGSKEDGMRVERMDSMEEPLYQESDGILEVGIQGKGKGEVVCSGSELTDEDGVSQRSEFLKNGKAELDFDLNYPSTDAIANVNGYEIVNHVIAIDSDSEDDSLNGDGESSGGLDVGEKSFELDIARSESSSYGEDSRFAAKKISYGKYDNEKAQIYKDDEDKLEIGLGLLPFNPKSRY